MATESYGRCDDGIHWTVYHWLGGPWWWKMRLPDGSEVRSPELYATEEQALDAVGDAREQARKGLPAVETVAQLRARAEAAEAALKQAEADARWALAELVRLDESEGTNTLGCWRDAGLSDAEQEALSVLAFQPSPEGADDLAAVRRILAAGGAR